MWSVGLCLGLCGCHGDLGFLRSSEGIIKRLAAKPGGGGGSLGEYLLKGDFPCIQVVVMEVLLDQSPRHVTSAAFDWLGPLKW